MPTFALSDVEIVAVSICKGPANRKRIFLKKTAPGAELIPLPQRAPSLIRKAEGDSWTVLYSVVAEPGNHEDPGSADRHDGTDVWADAEEIRKASHGFMRSGATVNLQHKDMNAVGKVVENFVAPVDMTIDTPDGTESIRKGAWVIGIEPDATLRAAIDAGELDGVSYEGTGVRTLAKASDLDTAGTHRTCQGCNAKMSRTASKCPNCGKAYVAKAATMTHEPTVPPGGPGLFGMKGKQLPAFIQHVFNDLVDSGHPHTAATYRLAVGIVQNWARGSDGKGGKVSAKTQAKAAAAIAEWEKLKAEAKADNVKKSGERMSLLAKIAEKLGVEADPEPVGVTDEEKALLLPAVTLSKENETEDDDVPLTDEQKAALAKVAGIESTVNDLVKDDGRLSGIERSLGQITERLPTKEPTDEEKRTALEEKIDAVSADLAKARGDLDALAQGDSGQARENHENVKKSDPDAELASALFG